MKKDQCYRKISYTFYIKRWFEKKVPKTVHKMETLPAYLQFECRAEVTNTFPVYQESKS